MRKLLPLVVWSVAILACSALRAGEGKDKPDAFSREDEVLKYLDERAPGVARDLRQERKDGAEMYEQDLASWAEVMDGCRKTAETSPEEAELELKIARLQHESDRLADRIRDTEDRAAKEALKKELRDKLNEIFDGQLLQKEKEIARLRAEARRLEETVARRRENKERIVNRRLGDLLEDDDLSWW